jgi:ubiquinone/menaquinone biosynthesis C-methylase UbiE
MQLYDATAHVYDKRHENATTRHLRKREMEMLKKYTKGLVLDIGCGTGVYSGISDDYIGIDVSKNMLAEAVKKRKNHFAVAAAEHLPFSDYSFDTTICMFTVLNLCDHKKAVKEMKRVMKTNGTAIVSVASVWDKKNYSFFEKLKDGNVPDAKSVRIEKEKLKFKLFKKNELIEMFEKEGFTLREFHGVYKWQEPFWNKYVDFGHRARIKLILERVLPSKTARIYVVVFRLKEGTSKKIPQAL